jgi:hypothetical protein
MQTDLAMEPINALKNSPVFAMSLSSKELFHSNMLGWVCSNVEGAWVDLFGPEMKKPLPAEMPAVWRERSKLDLTLEFAEGRLVVIENKVKSLPGNEQLHRYRDLTSRHRPAMGVTDLIVLTMGSVETAVSSEWRLIDYGAISRRLAAVADRCPRYHRALLRDYSAVVGALNSLAQIEPVSWMNLPPGVDALRIKDLFEKRKADRLRRLLSDELRARNITVRDDKSIGHRDDVACAYIHHGLTRTQGLVGAVTRIGDIDLTGDGKMVGVVAGVQVQGGQLRSYVEFQIPEKPGSPLSEALKGSAEELFASIPPGPWSNGGEREPLRAPVVPRVNQFDGRFFYTYISLSALSEAEKTLGALALRMAGMLEGAIADRRDILNSLTDALAERR